MPQRFLRCRFRYSPAYSAANFRRNNYEHLRFFKRYGRFGKRKLGEIKDEYLTEENIDRALEVTGKAVVTAARFAGKAVKKTVEYAVDHQDEIQARMERQQAAAEQRREKEIRRCEKEIRRDEREMERLQREIDKELSALDD